MHQVLQIQEILCNIFGHCRLPTSWHTHTSDLPALARTCRAFKEPALDVLWKELLDPSPLVRCLPDSDASGYNFYNDCYSFLRSLTQIEWGILRSYTRRIRSMLDEKDALDWESVMIFLNLPTTEPLFPNLRHLHTKQSSGIEHFLCMSFPSLISLSIDLSKEDEQDPYLLQGPLESLSKLSPNIRRLSIHPGQPDMIAFGNFFSGYICRWQDLQTVDCRVINLDVDALAHLSRMTALTRLRCTLCTLFPASVTPLVFSNLDHLTLRSDFLEPLSRLLSRTRLPAVTEFYTIISRRPSKEDFTSFLVSVQTSVIGHNIQELGLDQAWDEDEEVDTRLVLGLGLEDLQPCTSFNNLRCINLNLEWNVNLTDSDLLALASSWPHLERLLINEDHGWKTPGGITPNGLAQLLQACRSLCQIALAIDTRGFIEFRESRASLGLTSPHVLSVDVLDSLIEAESVPAMAAFFAAITPPSSRWFSFYAYRGCSIITRMEHRDRWFDVGKRARDASGQTLMAPHSIDVVSD
ncbi:hypothetical protein OG21DRAFT_1447879 [Imleria badia]|nr:hypothetical protein OG21DRAFT_1447879 [Imleria badia]